MSEQGGSNRVWMAIAALATAAAIYFALRGPTPPPGSPPPTTAGPSAESATLPEGATGLAQAASPTWPTAPEVGDEPAPPANAERLLRDMAHVPQLAAKAMAAAGGEEAIARFLAATYHRMTTETGGVLSGVIVHGETGLGLHTLQEVGVTLGGGGDACWVRRADGLVTPCNPEAQLVLIMERFVHHVTLRFPLARPPYKLLKAGVSEDGDGATNNYIYEMMGTPWKFHVAEQASTLRPTRVTIWSDGEPPFACDLSSWRTFGGVAFPTVRRCGMRPPEDGQEGHGPPAGGGEPGGGEPHGPGPGEGPGGPHGPGPGEGPGGPHGPGPGEGPGEPQGPGPGAAPHGPGPGGPPGGGPGARPDVAEPTVFTITITEVTPGVGDVELKPPPITGPGPMQIGTRPALMALHMPLPAQSAIVDVIREVDAAVQQRSLPVDPELYQALGVGDNAADLRKNMEIWFVPLSLSARSVRLPVHNLAAATRVARKVARFAPGEFAARFAAFIKEVKRAGHEVMPGVPPLIRVLDTARKDEGDPTSVDLESPWLVELQLTLRP